MASHQFEGPDELLSLDLMGDWVIDPDAPPAAKLAALTGIIREAHGTTRPFRATPAGAGGDRRDRPVRARRLSRAARAEVAPPVHRFIDPARGGQKTGTPDDFFQNLAVYAGRRSSTRPRARGRKELTWVVQNSAYLANKPPGRGASEFGRSCLTTCRSRRD
jgi:hypothetical protein